ncbi:MAG TPA: hypothetical protein VG267_13565 [Terracidiphilus sp.]|nr:hypothetical protein [Terracidiphilus sp.]
MRRLFSSLGGPSILALSTLLILIPLSMGRSAVAQTSATQADQGTEVAVGAGVPVIPQQVRYNGKLANRAGQTVDVVFRIYAVPEDGEPLWTETQRIPLSEDGSYSVLLGSADPKGLPQGVFAAGMARWLGVSVEQAPETDRVLLASVPYAMKSADAEALAGHAAADFVTQEQLARLEAQRAPALSPAAAISNTLGTVTGSGTTGTIPLWTGALTQGNSNMVQVGNNIGINEATPAAMLDVGGSEMLRGTLTMPSIGTATTSGGSYSQIMQFDASAWSSATSAAVTPIFKLYAFPEGNNTANPSSTFFFQYQLGATTTNVLSVASNGLMTTNGGLAMRPQASATASAAVNSPQFVLGASSYSSGTSSAVAQNFVWQVLATGNNTATPSGNLALLYGSGTHTPAATGLSILPTGIINWAAGQTFGGAGGGTITGITTSSPLTGSGTSGSVALGLNQSALATNITPNLETTFDSRYAKLSGGNVFSSYLQAHQTSGPTNAAVLGSGTNGSVGAFGNSDTGFGVQGESTSGYGVYAQVTNPTYGSAGVLGFTGAALSSTYAAEKGIANAGVWADNSGGGAGIPVALFATADDAFGEVVVTNGVSYPAIIVTNNGGTSAQFTATQGYGVDASTTTGTGVFGATTGSGLGVEGLNSSAAEQDAGVLGIANLSSGIYGSYDIYAGVWGDTGVSSTAVAPAWAIGVLGTADDSHAGVFINDSSSWSTLYLQNNSTGGTSNSAGGIGSSAGGSGIFNTLMASTADGTCGIGSGGSLSCTGPIKSLASASNGARTVETYGVQSPENWMEDFGTGQLQKGVAVVTIDATFAETVSETADYHVFLTPRADSKGLYVINATPTSFEVRESGGGTSSLSFDYRIVARRRGYEALRHVDVTERYKAEMKAASMARGSGLVRRPPAMAMSPFKAALDSNPRIVTAARRPVPQKPMSRPANTTSHP